ncbi:flagellar assembly protein H [Escherichia coli]|nr:flagellar assembly protein H [Escherichia coli]
MSELTTNKSNSYLEQAAILLLCLGEEAAATVMQKLSREEVVRLSENMARLSGVKTSMARKVINNFFDEFREQSGINGASRSMLQGILNKALGTEIASSVINGIYGDEIRSRMARLQWVEPRQLAMLISEEHLQLQAVFLAFLTPEISAAVLSYLNESVQNEILYRVAKLNDVNRDVVDELDRLIERGLSVLSEHGSKVKGIKQAADIVNRFQGNQQVILDQMRERDEEVLGQIQDEMYDFFILSRQNEEVRRRLLDEVPMEDWAVALKGTEALLRRSIYAVMPKRQAQPLEAITGKVNDFLAHIERKQREDLLQLVEKVTRQVIRCELALQPTQLLALVEEALAAFPTMPETLQVMLSTEEFNRLRDAVPEKVSEWGLTPSPDLPPGECRVITDKSELDIGCEHRLEQCMTALQETLTPESQGE